MCASGFPSGDQSPAWEPKWGESTSATLWTEDIMLRTYWRAMDATLSCRWLSKANWNAIVMTDMMLLPEAELSVEDLFPNGPTSRAAASAKVRFGLDAS